MKNAISIDLEDWFCVYNLSDAIKREDWDKQELRVEKSTRRILKLLARHNTRATFFLLGWIAERVPDLVEEIHAAGHEIATHGYSHRLLTEMAPGEFRNDLDKALRITEKITDEKILGFRAPSFSITPQTMWAFEVLEDCGLRYDSSVFPVGFHPDYGIPTAPLSVYPISDRLTEFPISCVDILGRRIPVSGGGYFRAYPYWLSKFFITRCNREGRSVVFYIHPWEFDVDQPRISLSILKRWRHYINLQKTEKRFDKLLTDFEFVPIREVLGL